MSASFLSPCCPRGVVSAVPSTNEFPSFSLPPPSAVVRSPNCRRCSFGGLSSHLASENGGSTFSHSLCFSPSSAFSNSSTFALLKQHLKLPSRAMSVVSAPFSRLPPVFPPLNSEQSSSQHSRAESCLELEALSAVHQFAGTVQDIAVSEMLPRTPDLIFVNVTTLEAQPFCLELTAKGWRVTSLRSDCMQGDFTRMELFTNYYQSLHQLMDKISPEYRNQFTRKASKETTDSLAFDENEEKRTTMVKRSEC